ncbi:Leukotriene-B(4) omega-hydroxylase 2 [Seminavis robusta]|uniref:Leukotriene-B(4) omega-hydroxylase 2 n=1 Tax=Seminavis robusta TaxID=568900 RepID=A0A9N8DF34_9STRA|nr:Leukotriene-B(4) omega-hydroxylase 2 [Seminavis robusta]|eukprot:Sro40_g024580.1 Leukotriene-B(4) omega-hydroxylase 2 (553) ;mRNA; r:41038-42696
MSEQVIWTYENCLLASPYWVTLLVAVAMVAIIIVKPFLELRKPFDNLPMAPHCHWFYGHVAWVFGRETFPDAYVDAVRDHADAHGRTGLWLLYRRCISIVHVEDARTILKSEHHRIPVPIVSHYVRKVIGKQNLLFLNHREWKQNRDAVTRTFVHSFLVQSQTDVWQVAQDLIATLSNKLEQNSAAAYYELDVHPVMKMLTSDVFGKAAFSTDFECCKTLQFSSVVGAFEYIMKDMGKRGQNPLSPWNYFFSLPLEKNRKLQEQLNVLRGFIQNLLQESRIKMKQLDNNLSPKNNSDKDVKISLVDRLVVAHDSNNSNNNNATDDEILIDVISTLLIASYDTTSTTLAFVLYLLAANPGVQEACFAEVQSIEGDLTDPDVLVYCTAVIQECLRLYPPAAISARDLTKPITLSDGFVVPPNVKCLVPIFAIHRSEQYFPRPLECIPERWCQRTSSSNDNNAWMERTPDNDITADTTIAIGNAHALIPFSVGSRNCPGNRFALQEAVIVLANLVREFQFKPVPGYQLKLDLHGPLPQPRHGMPLRIEKRQTVVK